MARTALTVTTLTGNSTTAQATTSVAALVSPGASILPPQGCEKLLLVLVNSAGTTKTCTVVAGADEFSSPSGPAWMKGQGDLVGTVAAGSAAPLYFGPFDSSRFIQNDGLIYLNFASGFTGTIEVYSAPNGY